MGANPWIQAYIIRCCSMLCPAKIQPNLPFAGMSVPFPRKQGFYQKKSGAKPWRCTASLNRSFVILVFGAFAIGLGPCDKGPDVLIGGLQVFLPQVHHMAGSVALELEAVLHTATGVDLGHGVFGRKI